MKSFKSTIITLILLTGLILNSCYNKGKPNTKSVHLKHKKIDSFELLRPSLWIYGMFNDKDRQRQIVDKWYNFYFRIVGTDVVNDSLVAAVEEHNKITDSILSKRIGKNWQARFEHSVDSLYSVDSTAIVIAKSDPFISDFYKNTEKHNVKYDFYPNLKYTTFATQVPNIKVVTIEGYGLVYGRIGNINYLRATIDMKLRKVINIDKIAYGE
jgi:hypothetical protein